LFGGYYEEVTWLIKDASLQLKLWLADTELILILIGYFPFIINKMNCLIVNINLHIHTIS